MSLELVEAEIRRFLSSEDPEVICISGHWGVGKTYAWNQYVEDAQKKGLIALKRYSYVSLFGINSLDDFKYAIFENSVKSSDIGIKPSLETLQSNTSAAIEASVRKSIKVIQQTPILKNYLGGLAPVWFSSVEKTVVCVDDFERRGKNLTVRDVLGLVNNLKELKSCKVCLILNDEALEEDEGDFRKYLEKVVDTTLRFKPSAEDCARIALIGDTEVNRMLAEYCIKLGISNIRVIKKIERSLHQIEPMLATFDKEVLRQVVHSLALLGWSAYEPTKAPPLDFLERKNTIDFASVATKKPISPQEAAWNALLLAYQFSSMDEFDRALLSGIREGFFDPTLIKKEASNLNDKIEAGNLDASFHAAWDMYHDSFDDNQGAVLDAMYDSFFRAVQYITPLNMNSTVALFKVLGRAGQAAEMIAHYVESRGEQREIFDLRNYPFAGEVSDADVIQAFDAKYATFKQTTAPSTILLRMADTNSWNPEDITALSSLSVDEYYEMLKVTRGRDLRKIISSCLQFDNIANATPDMKEISKRAKDALRRIGKESAINARRVKTYGVDDSAATHFTPNCQNRNE
jgi:hypothetical protein